MVTVPSSSMLICEPVFSLMPLMFLPPGPMISPIFSVGTLREMTLGAKSEMSLRGWEMVLVHDAQDVQAAFAGLCQGLGQDLRAHALDLDVHLQGGDAVFGARNLEVHVAEVIFFAEDVAQDDELVAFLHQSHGDARNGLLHADAGVQEAQRASADRGHGRGAVGLEDLRDDADRVRESSLSSAGPC